ncbi:MtrAB system histidine kinase MtrB [Citricoccus nitrophenolicus]|uniref:Sensor histidine kinase MtrB n=1 Tax=Citricoccus nitrophenolicus TaxID=863575 RepID=A0ABV0IM02_9MICC|nr:MtrAB system histidine kinase MtrB [Citricoccus sp. I39-566]WMY77728.1 MtrAB system histidine kinase MtrB [Citricoccus sp. I39-566]
MTTGTVTAPEQADSTAAGSDAGALARFRTLVAGRFTAARRRWTASLQLRTVASTAVLTLVAAGVLALFLSQQITSGLFQSRFDQVEAESNRGLNQARSIFENANTNDPETTDLLVTNTLNQLAGDTGATVIRDMVLVPLEDTQNLFVGPKSSSGLSADVIPAELSEAVQNGSGTYWRSIGLPAEDGGTSPALAFGTQVTLPPGNIYALYMVYDLTSVQDTLDYLMRVLVVAGAMLVMMNSLIAVFVTRSVVRPVGQAASAAETLSSGDLSVRMPVRGEDEMARLGTSFNRMADNIQDQITQLAELSQMQQRFVSDVSHELRTPLTTVRMAAEVLYDSRDGFDAINRRSTELLYHQVERFQALLADLLEITRFDAGAATMAPEKTDILHLATDVVLTAQPLAHKANTAVYVVPMGTEVTAYVDPRRIERIVRNLVNNAIEHGEARPVDVIVGGNEDAVAVVVRDHGIGMSEEQASHVFDRFWRGDPARARTTGGSGLGLSIALEDTRLHNGRLDAWGHLGRGSAFRLVIPRSSGGAVGEESPLGLPPVYHESQRRLPADLENPEPSQLTGEVLPDRVQEQSLYPQRPEPPESAASPKDTSGPDEEEES